ncbi:MAG: response regulator transcription factor [Ketobacteraceae bacterium]|nr:response regulator transcription factor [Ketobacteraceae bacterium]
MKQALLIEDHEETRQWMEEVLAEAFPSIVIHLAETLQEAADYLQQQQYSIALVDINLPDGSGIDLIPLMQKDARVGYIVMSTIFDDDDHLFKAIQSGAHGYLLKDQPRDQLLVKLQGILRGDPPLSPGIARRLLSYYRQNTSTKPDDDDNSRADKPESLLSPREEEAITLIAKGLTVKEMAAMLNITANTASGYVKSAYRKLNVNSRAEASLKAVEMGLVKSSSR